MKGNREDAAASAAATAEVEVVSLCFKFIIMCCRGTLSFCMSGCSGGKVGSNLEESKMVSSRLV